MAGQRRVLLGQLGANGDCVYATTVARQIKADFPDCHLTWAIGSMCRHVIAHNPHVDDVWEVPLARRADSAAAWRQFVRDARGRQQQGDFDDVYLTQIYPDNLHNFDGTVRASIFRGYSGPITVPVTPVIRLDAEDVARVAAFAARHGLTKAGRAILFESAPLSGQSPMTSEWVAAIARELARALPDCRLISASPLGSGGDGVIDASGLGFRDISELARYCSLFVGCSSGITWLLTSDAAPPIPMVQILSARAGDYGAVVHDLDYWGLPSGHVIELRDGTAEQAASCVIDAMTHGIAAARQRHHQELAPRFDFYMEMMVPKLRQGELRTFARSLRAAVARYGPRPVLIDGLARHVLRKLVGRYVKR